MASVTTVRSDALAYASEEKPLRRHVLDLDDFYFRRDRRGVEQCGRDARSAAPRHQEGANAPGPGDRYAVYEASTRTRISFEAAGKILSADVINMSATASSVEKGESLLNTGLTLQAMGVDTIVVRHPHSGAPHFLARNPSQSIRH